MQMNVSSIERIGIVKRNDATLTFIAAKIFRKTMSSYVRPVHS